MTSKAKVIKSISKKDTLVLPCEWGDCDVVCEQIDEYLKHVSVHISKTDLTVEYAADGKLTKEAIEETEDNLVCQWRECGSEEPFPTFLDFLRHVYYHTYHTKLKGNAMILIFKNNMEGCQFDSATRNCVPEINSSFQCGWGDCQASYDNPNTYYMHVQNHIDTYNKGNNPMGGCSCHWEGCDMIARSKHKLRDHVRSHTQEKVMACPTCGGMYANSTKFVDHIKRQKGGDDFDMCAAHQFQCLHCSKTFCTERLLRDHMRQHVNHYKCPVCDMTCANPHGLRNHLRYRHSDERPFKCTQCDYTAKSSSDIESHMAVHLKQRISCQVENCSFTCRRLSEMDQHYRKTHSQQGDKWGMYTCHVCEGLFGRGEKLTRHLKIKHNFKWPSGHKRFRYKMHEDGLYRLQMVRYESIELAEQLFKDKMNKPTASSASETGNKPQDGENAADSDKDDAAPGENLNYNLQMLGNVAAALDVPEARPAAGSNQVQAPNPQPASIHNSVPNQDLTTINGSDASHGMAVASDMNLLNAAEHITSQPAEHAPMSLSVSDKAGAVPVVPRSITKRLRKDPSPRKRKRTSDCASSQQEVITSHEHSDQNHVRPETKRQNTRGTMDTSDITVHFLEEGNSHGPLLDEDIRTAASEMGIVITK